MLLIPLEHLIWQNCSQAGSRELKWHVRSAHWIVSSQLNSRPQTRCEIEMFKTTLLIFAENWSVILMSESHYICRWTNSCCCCYPFQLELTAWSRNSPIKRAWFQSNQHRIAPRFSWMCRFLGRTCHQSIHRNLKALQAEERERERGGQEDPLTCL
jgi:hypothetical protein